MAGDKSEARCVRGVAAGGPPAGAAMAAMPRLSNVVGTHPERVHNTAQAHIHACQTLPLFDLAPDGCSRRSGTDV